MTMSIEIGDFPRIGVSHGWQCPVCGRVYSPFTQMCFYCQYNGQQPVITNDKTVPDRTPIRDMIVGGIDIKQTLGGNENVKTD